MSLLTIAAIAKEIGIPESTARFYRDKFEKYIPSHGEGRGRRYPTEALDVLRFVAERMKENETVDEIEAALKLRFAINVDLEPQSSRSAAVMVFGEVMSGVMEGLVREELRPIVERLDELQQQNDELKNYIAASLEERDQRLVAAMRNMMEQKQQKKGLFGRLFGKG